MCNPVSSPRTARCARLATVIQISSIELRAHPETPRTTAPAAAGQARPRPTVLLRACRPRQWAKNVLLVAAPAAAGVLGDGAVALRVVFAIASFCMLSSATYLLNDVRDREQDRAHPRKQHRPVASGALSVRAALAFALALAAAGLGLAAAIRPELAAVGAGYLLLTATYSVWLRHIVLLDIIAIAGAFVVRAAAGGVAVDVPLSRWFLVVTSAGALFIVAGKRHAELFGADNDASTRATLRLYSEGALRLIMAAAVAGTLVAYAIWAFRRPERGPWYEATIVPVVLWLGRYWQLVARGAGEAPEELILRDPPLLALSLLWTALFIGGIYVGR